jgi:hypothetical protein
MSEEKEKGEKKRRRSRLTSIGKTTIVGVRKVRYFGGCYYVALPKEFLDRNNLKAGDELPFVGNHILKFVPVQEERREEEGDEIRDSKRKYLS